MELDISRFDLQAAMANAMTLVRGRAERHGIRLASEVGEEWAPTRATSASSSRSC
jgi:hypothetical protein